MTARHIIRSISVRITRTIVLRVMTCQETDQRIMTSGSVITLLSRCGKQAKSTRRELFKWQLIRLANGASLHKILMQIPTWFFHPLRWKQIKRLLLPRHLERELGRDNLLYLQVQILPRLNKQRQWPRQKGKRVEKGKGGYLPFPSKHWQLLQGH